MSGLLPNNLPEPEVRTMAAVYEAYRSEGEADYWGDSDLETIEAFYVFRLPGMPDSIDPYEAGLVIDKLHDGHWRVIDFRDEHLYANYEDALDNVREFAIREGYLIEPAEVYRDALVDVLASAFIFDDNGVCLYPAMDAETRLDAVVEPETTALIGARLRPLVQERKAAWAAEDEQ